MFYSAIPFTWEKRACFHVQKHQLHKKIVPNVEMNFFQHKSSHKHITKSIPFLNLRTVTNHSMQSSPAPQSSHSHEHNNTVAAQPSTIVVVTSNINDYQQVDTIMNIISNINHQQNHQRNNHVDITHQVNTSTSQHDVIQRSSLGKNNDFVHGSLDTATSKKKKKKKKRESKSLNVLTAPVRTFQSVGFLSWWKHSLSSTNWKIL